MSRGLGRIQKIILENLEEKKGDWIDVSSIIYQIVNGIDCFKGGCRNDEIIKPTESEKQSVWRAVRRLEKLGYIESRIKTHPPRIHKDTKDKEIRKIKV